MVFAKLHVVIAFLLISEFAIAQKCGVGDEFHEMLKHGNDNSRIASISPVNGILYIPITIHQVRRSNGTYSKNSSLEPFYHSLVSLNRIFSEVHIQFYVNGNIDYVDNDAYLKPTLNGVANQQLITNHKNANTANVWIFDGWSDATSTVGYAGPSGVQLADLAERTVIHEFGHFFTLAHTFDYANGVERVARTGGNCATAGDGICDTEADPSDLSSSQVIGGAFTFANCKMTSNTRDLNNAVYTPPFDNFMSYYNNTCGFKFSPQQFDRMVASIPVYHSAYNEMQGAGIAGAPSALNIVSNIGYDEISWTNSSGSIATLVEYSKDGGTTWDVMNGTTNNQTKLLLSNVFVGKNYSFRARHLNSIAYSATITYSPTYAHAMVPLTSYASSTSLYAIAGVQILNTSLNNQSNVHSMYSLNTYNQTPTLFIGGSNTLTLKLAKDSEGAYFAGYFFVYLDENRDGDFDDAGELKYQELQTTGYPTAPSVPLVISAQASAGYTRMRVRRFGQNTNFSPSLMYNNSETEDYLVQLIKDVPPTSLVGTYNQSNNSIGLTWIDNTNDYNYVIERSKDGITFSIINTTITTTPKTYVDLDIIPNQQYSYRIKHLNGAVYTSTIDVFTNNNMDLKYCTPVTNVPCNDFGISEFAIPSIGFVNNTEGDCGFSGSGYSDAFSTKTINLTAGSSYNYTVENIIDDFPSDWRYLKMYLDVNQNGQFDETSEVLINFNVTLSDFPPASFSVPSSAINGHTRLRLRNYIFSISNACSSASYGETEDYKVVISGGKEALVINPMITNVTKNQIAISWSPALSTNPTGYRLKISTDGITYSNTVTLNSSQTSYTYSGLTSDKKYFIQIVALGTTPSEPRTIWTQTLSQTTAVTGEEIDKNTAYAYPNPVSGILTIKANGTVSLVNSYGQVMRNEIVSETGYWDMNGFAAGIYFLYIQNEDQTQVLKIIKQ